MMLEKTSLYSHIGGGFLALLFGILSLIFKKGSRPHRKSGFVFFYAMLLTCISAMFLAVIKNSMFLFHVGVFALYQNYMGRRVIHNKSLQPKFYDILATTVSVLNAILMIGSLNFVLIVFGGISLVNGIGDFRLYYRVRKGMRIRSNLWLGRHISNMIGAFIATVTAFVVVNVTDFNPSWVPWLLPTVILVPIMIFHLRRIKK